MTLNKDLILMMRGPKGTRALNEALYPRVVAGDALARTQMIEANMSLVTNKVQAYLSQHPEWNHLRDDLISEGFVGLTQGVNKMAGIAGEDDLNIPVDVNNPTGLISTYIYHRLGDLIDKELGIRVPGRTFRRKRKAGEMVGVPVKESSLTVEDTLQEDALVDPRSMVDLQDELIGCCESPTEREIVRHRSEGRSDSDISDILGISKTTTYMMRRGIYARFLQRNPEYDGEV